MFTLAPDKGMSRDGVRWASLGRAFKGVGATTEKVLPFYSHISVGEDTQIRTSAVDQRSGRHIWKKVLTKISWI